MEKWKESIVQFPRRSLVSSGLGLILGASMMAGATVLGAQDTTQTTGMDDSVPDRPVHIHNGTCNSLGDIVAPLTDLALGGEGSGGLGVAGVSETNAGEDTLSTPAGDTGSDMTTGGTSDAGTDATSGDAMVIPVQYSFSTVPMSIDDILASDHAINVHQSEEEMSTFIACGDLGGEPDQNGSLVIGLRELNSSGYAGIAVLSPSGSVDGSTDVSVFIAEGLVDTGMTTEETPATAATPAEVVGTPDIDTGVIGTPGVEDATAPPVETPTDADTVEPTGTATEAETPDETATETETPVGTATETETPDESPGDDNGMTPPGEDDENND